VESWKLRYFNLFEFFDHTSFKYGAFGEIFEYGWSTLVECLCQFDIGKHRWRRSIPSWSKS
jgi:hypothetical protein